MEVAGGEFGFGATPFSGENAGGGLVRREASRNGNRSCTSVTPRSPRLAARHTALRDFRVLVIDTDPVLPTDTAGRGTINKLADNLAKAGVRIERSSPLLPDFAASSRLYMRMLMSFLAASFPYDVYANAQAVTQMLPPSDTSLGSERLRGMVMSHRDWVMADGARARLRAQWRELFKQYDAVICPIMPTPAYKHDHSDEQESRRIHIDGKPHVYPDQLSWPGMATLPGLPATAIPTASRTPCATSPPASSSTTSQITPSVWIAWLCPLGKYHRSPGA